VACVQKLPQQKAVCSQPWIENMTRIQVLALMPIVKTFRKLRLILQN